MEMDIFDEAWGGAKMANPMSDQEQTENAIARATAWAESEPGTEYGVTEPVRAAEIAPATEASRARGNGAWTTADPRGKR